MFLGLRTAAYAVEDLQAAKEWYSEVLGFVYWGVDDIEAALAGLTELGATVHGEMLDVGEGILVASVIDPFGNLLGIIKNPHFKAES